MYLQRCGSQQSTDRAKNILFYALWMLYVLTTTTIIIEMLQLFWNDAVSVDDHRCLTLFQLAVQKLEIRYHIDIIDATVFACCDVIAQIILVRTTGSVYHYPFNAS